MEDRKTKKYISAVYQYAFSRLVLHSALFYENMLESSGYSGEEEEVRREFVRLLKAFAEGAEDLGETEKLRNRIIARTEILTAYSDCFQIYEYVINRVERRFIDLPPSDYSPEEMAGALVAALARMKQPGDRNSSLRTMISCLPVRFTRQKFYSMVMESFKVYTGLFKNDVEDFIYMIKTSAMVQLPEHMDREEELYQILEALRQTDYRNLEKDRFEKCRAALSKGADLLMGKTDFYVSVQEMVNDIYILCLTKDNRTIDAAADQVFWQGIGKIQKALETGEQFSYEEEEQLLERMEGIQEAVEDVVMAGSTESDDVLGKLEKLVSASVFASLEEKEDYQETADRDWTEQQAQELCREFDRLFASVPKAVVRAVMATVLSSLPLMFESSQEIEDYIRSSLESCTDYAEREACLELLEQELME